MFVMKKIIVVVALIVGCLSCFGDWEKINDVLSMKNRQNTAVVAIVGGFDQECYCRFGSLDFGKLKFNGAIEVVTDTEKIVVKNAEKMTSSIAQFKITDEQYYGIKQSKKIKVKIAGRTYLFVK